MITVVIPHFYSQRRDNLRRIIYSLDHGSMRIDEVLIWNNDPELIHVHGAYVIQSHRNVGCQARILAALMARGDRVLFLDNDVAVNHKTIENLVRWHDELGGVVTVEGRQAVRGHYSQWPKIYGHGITTPTRLFLSLGRGEMVRRQDLNRVLHHFPFDPETKMDDLLLSQAYLKSKIPVHVIPCLRGVSDLQDLPMYGVGFCKEPNFYEQREKVASTIVVPRDEESLKAQAESA
jgi:hypothetical protein